MFEKAIVAYIDILGYKDLVKRATGKPELVKDMEDLFYTVFVKAGAGLSDGMGKLASDAEERAYVEKVAKTIRARCIADSFIFTLPVSKINFSYSRCDGKTTAGLCIETFLSVITLSATMFISKMGSPLRGGIAVGNHYESERKNQLFIFSEAHNRAAELEKAAKYPRIVLDETVLQYLTEISYPQKQIENFFYKEDDYYCLDIYSATRNWDNNFRRRKILAGIKEGITLNMQNNPMELDKLTHFAQYHNRWVCGNEINDSSLLINTALS